MTPTSQSNEAVLPPSIITINIHLLQHNVGVRCKAESGESAHGFSSESHGLTTFIVFVCDKRCAGMSVRVHMSASAYLTECLHCYRWTWSPGVDCLCLQAVMLHFTVVFIVVSL